MRGEAGGGGGQVEEGGQIEYIIYIRIYVQV